MGLFLLLLLPINMAAAAGSDDWSCESEVFCKPGEGVLHSVQMANIFKDSKTFVDMPMKFSEDVVLENFHNLVNSEDLSIAEFVGNNFDTEGTELESVQAEDWIETPGFVEYIEDEDFKKLALKMNSIWKHLTRRMNKTRQEIEERSSLIYLENAFVVPGGRFRELYYWDSYWTIKGLLLSEMFDTTRGMIQNFKQLIQKLGHIPNGNRLYYSKRSQPPLLAQMVQDYLDATDDPAHAREFMAEVIWELVTEFEFWEKRMVEVEVEGETHRLARYRVEVDGPRPESYREDVGEASKFTTEEERKNWYIHMNSGAESGWDYSSRWFVSNVSRPAQDELLDVRTGDIIPVDLNSFLCRNAEIMSQMFKKLENPSKAAEYDEKKEKLRASIRAVLFSDDGMWYDYNTETRSQNKKFYPSNLSPLYSNCYHSDINMNRTVDTILALNDTLLQPGGVPSSATESSQQWDFPNVWPPLVELTVTALENTNDSRLLPLAKKIAGNFLRNVLRSEQSTGHIYEKYDCRQTGKPGGGGEYDVQEGFGWTNGVAMTLLARYPEMPSASSSLPSLSLLLLPIMLLIFIM